MILRTPRTVAAARAGFTLTEMLVVVAIIVVFVNLIVDISYGFLNPKIRLS